MEYSFIPLLIILGALTVIVVIIVRKYPQLSLLDVENLPEVKEEKKKDEYIKKQAEKNAEALKERWGKMMGPIVAKAKATQLFFRQFVGRVERKSVALITERTRRAKPAQKNTDKNELRTALAEANQSLERKNYEQAEAQYLAIIRLDPKHPEAYQGLGDVYFAQGHAKEAKETYLFLHHLAPANEHSIVRLAEIAEADGRVQEAVEYYQQAVLLNDNKSPRFFKIADLLRGLGHYDTALEAIKQAVELEPENPKYLDFLVEISILAGDKTLAEAAYQQLRMVNPDNQKLPILKDKIEQMS